MHRQTAGDDSCFEKRRMMTLLQTTAWDGEELTHQQPPWPRRVWRWIGIHLWTHVHRCPRVHHSISELAREGCAQQACMQVCTAYNLAELTYLTDLTDQKAVHTHAGSIAVKERWWR